MFGPTRETPRHPCRPDAIGANILAIPDTVWSHAAFANTHQLSFPLLGDHRPRGKLARAYGVFDTSHRAVERALLVIDRFGTIVWSAVSKCLNEVGEVRSKHQIPIAAPSR
ncbi:MAG TPA: redoxin domain-containing protein [Chloroflexota bacterium]|nr:redoxin domain-containing protein [Chloroflexota bacterium]